jgi:hypothetical protein
MRTFLIAAIATLALAAPAGAATRNFGITSFTKVRVEGPYRVNLATGVAPFARASGSPAALDRVSIDMRGETLVVQASSSWGGDPGANNGPVEISLGTHDLTSASLTGAGALTIDRVKGLAFTFSVAGSGVGEIQNVAIDQLNVTLLGTVKGTLAGHAGRVEALVRGIATLDAAKLVTPNAAIAVDGMATVDANVTDTAKVDAWGPATIRFTGRPSCTSKVTGAASITGCK